MPRFFRAYNDLLKLHPFKMNMLTSALFFGLGDCCAQHIVLQTADPLHPHPSRFLADRCFRAVIYGGLVYGPLSVCWQIKTLPRIKNPLLNARRRAAMHPSGRHFYDTAFRVFVDQLFFPSLVWIPLYNTVLVTLAGHPSPLAVLKEKLRKNWWRVLSTSWLVWPPFQFVNLFLVPVHLRVVAANVWLVGWNAFLSYVHHAKGRGRDSGHVLDRLVDSTDPDEEPVVVYN